VIFFCSYFKEERIRSHIFLCWLALLLVRIAERRTGMTWSKMRNELERIQLGHFSVNKKWSLLYFSSILATRGLALAKDGSENRD